QRASAWLAGTSPPRRRAPAARPRPSDGRSGGKPALADVQYRGAAAHRDGHGVRVGAGRDGLATVVERVQQARPPIGAQLAEDVVEQEDRPRAGRREVIALSQEERQQRGPLLALAAQPAEVDRTLRVDRGPDP